MRTSNVLDHRFKIIRANVKCGSENCATTLKRLEMWNWNKKFCQRRQNVWHQKLSMQQWRQFSDEHACRYSILGNAINSSKLIYSPQNIFVWWQRRPTIVIAGRKARFLLVCLFHVKLCKFHIANRIENVSQRNANSILSSTMNFLPSPPKWFLSSNEMSRKEKRRVSPRTTSSIFDDALDRQNTNQNNN